MGKNIVLWGLLFALFISCKSQNEMIDKTVVKDFDIERYLGTWYEIARFDHRFERGLTGVSANYSWREDGKIKVMNSGYKNGEKSEIEGKAKIPNPDEPAKLKVSFFWFFYSNYYVMELDEDYQWAAVGSSSDKYLWVLSRLPQMEDDLYKDIIRRLKNRGYDVSKLIEVTKN